MPSEETPPRRRVRVRIERQLTFAERIMERFAMARLPRRQRNERIAIMTMLFVAALYFALRPIVMWFFRPASSQPSALSPASPPAQKDETPKDKQRP